MLLGERRIDTSEGVRFITWVRIVTYLTIFDPLRLFESNLSVLDTKKHLLFDNNAICTKVASNIVIITSIKTDIDIKMLKCGI